MASGLLSTCTLAMAQASSIRSMALSGRKRCVMYLSCERNPRRSLADASARPLLSAAEFPPQTAAPQPTSDKGASLHARESHRQVRGLYEGCV